MAVKSPPIYPTGAFTPPESASSTESSSTISSASSSLSSGTASSFILKKKKKITILEQLQKIITKSQEIKPDCPDYWQYSSIYLNNVQTNSNILSIIEENLIEQHSNPNTHFFVIKTMNLDNFYACTINLQKIIWKQQTIPLILSLQEIMTQMNPIYQKLNELLWFSTSAQSNRLLQKIKEKHSFSIIIFFKGQDVTSELLREKLHFYDISQVIMVTDSFDVNLNSIDLQTASFIEVVSLNKHYRLLLPFVAFFAILILIIELIITIFYSFFNQIGSNMINEELKAKLEKNKKLTMFSIIIFNIISSTLILILFSLNLSYKTIFFFLIIINMFFLFLYINWYHWNLFRISNVQTINVSYVILNLFSILLFSVHLKQFLQQYFNLK